MLSVVSCLTVWAHENVLSSSEVAMSKYRPDFRLDSRAECLWHQKGEGSQNVSLRELFHIGTTRCVSPFGCDHTSPAAISCQQLLPPSMWKSNKRKVLLWFKGNDSV